MSAYGMDIEREWECACLLQYSNMRALAANVASKMPLFVLRTHDMSVPRARLHVYLGAQGSRQTEETDGGCERREEGGGERRAVGGGRWRRRELREGGQCCCRAIMLPPQSFRSTARARATGVMPV